WIDYDNDGDLDLIFENDGYGIDILANDGSGWLSHATPDGDTLGLPAGGSSGDYLAVGDYDADGWVDVLARKDDGHGLYHGAGDGSFELDPSISAQASGGNKGGVTFCDLDADGDLDVFWTDGGDNQIWRNHSGAFAATGEPALSSGVEITGNVSGVACGDADNDGDLDLFLAGAGASYLFLNDTTTGSTSPFAFHHDNLQIDVGAGATDAGFADIDRDGDL
ncbi:MAG: VCBS repeat-containing protein, partial [bacterium]|nr:VCBS repeat-containing protein [bacterium]